MSVRKRTWTILGGGVALALTITAASAAEDVATIMPGCRALMDDRVNTSRIFDAGYCAGMIDAIGFMGDALSWQALALPKEIRQNFCISAPLTVTIKQAVRIVVAYIDARPDRMHEPFSQLAIEALRTVWPC